MRPQTPRLRRTGRSNQIDEPSLADDPRQNHLSCCSDATGSSIGDGEAFDINDGPVRYFCDSS